jgi:hypothetical protein
MGQEAGPPEVERAMVEGLGDVREDGENRPYLSK